MTLESTITKAVYQGNGVTRVFPIPFALHSASHVCLVHTNSVGKDKAIHYTYAVHDVGVGEEPYVEYPADPEAPALPEGDRLTVMRVVPLTQQTNLENGGNLHAEVLERQFDLITMQLQQLAEELGRIPKFPASTLEKDTDLALFIDRLDALVARAYEAARRAEAVGDAKVIREGTENLSATWVSAAMSAGELMDLPINYLPGRNVLQLSLDGVLCFGSSANGAQGVLQYAEVLAEGDLSHQVRLLFDVPAGGVWHAFVLASNLTRIALEDMESASRVSKELQEALAQAGKLTPELMAEAQIAAELLEKSLDLVFLTPESLQEAKTTASRLETSIALLESMELPDASAFLQRVSSLSPAGSREELIVAGQAVSTPAYRVGAGSIQVFLDGILAISGEDPLLHQYYEQGEEGLLSTAICFHDDIAVDLDVLVQAPLIT